MDPDKYNPHLAEGIENFGVSLILAGGSRIKKRNSLRRMIQDIRKRTSLPVVIFPSSSNDIYPADGVLFTSLLSGNSVRYIAGEQIRSSLKIKKFQLKTFPVAYLLVGNNRSAIRSVSNTRPLSLFQRRKILSVALAGQYMGFRGVYLEAGSGAKKPLPSSLIKFIKNNVEIPLIVGGGVRTTSQIKKFFSEGADVVVVGNVLEEKPELVLEFKNIFI